MTWRGVVAGWFVCCAGWREGGRERGGGARGETVFFTPKKGKWCLGQKRNFLNFDTFYCLTFLLQCFCFSSFVVLSDVFYCLFFSSSLALKIVFLGRQPFFTLIPKKMYLTFTFVVDNDTTLHAVHTVLIKCSICSYHQSLTRTPHEWVKKTIHDKQSYFYQHGSEALRCAEFGDRCSSLAVVVDNWLGELSCGDTEWT